MNLGKEQKERIHQVWNEYIENGEKFINASQEFTNEELNQRRRDVIPEVLGWLNRFLNGEVPLEEFKTANDGINKRNRLWGFQAINGQMFFNVLTKNSNVGNSTDEFIELLKVSLPVPPTISAAKSVIEKFTLFTRDLGQYSADARGAPKVGSIPFFLSYFWQIQQPDKYPVYYTSMVNALSSLDIWSPSGEVADDYLAFYQLNQDMVEFLSKETGGSIHLWDVEHAFWYYKQVQTELETPPSTTDTLKEQPVAKKESKPAQTILEELSESFIPPVVAALPRIAMNDEVLDEHYRNSGRAIERCLKKNWQSCSGCLDMIRIYSDRDRVEFPMALPSARNFVMPLSMMLRFGRMPTPWGRMNGQFGNILLFRVSVCADRE